MIQFDEHIFEMGWNHQLELVDQIFVDEQCDPTGSNGGALLISTGETSRPWALQQVWAQQYKGACAQQLQ